MPSGMLCGLAGACLSIGTLNLWSADTSGEPRSLDPRSGRRRLDAAARPPPRPC
jgi:hypothetical protein